MKKADASAINKAIHSVMEEFMPIIREAVLEEIAKKDAASGDNPAPAPRLSDTQCHAVLDAARMRVSALPKKARKDAAIQLWRSVRQRFGYYRKARADQFDELIQHIQTFDLSASGVRP